MSDVEIKLEGLDDVLKKLDKIGGRGFFKEVMKAGANDIKDWIQVYPPSTEANMPRGHGEVYSISTRKRVNSWYERQYGPRWYRKDGSLGGSQTSEKLKMKWSNPKASSDGLEVTFGNNASYAPNVHDEKEQPQFHAARGWRTVQDAFKKKGPEVIEKIRGAINDALGRG